MKNFNLAVSTTGGSNTEHRFRPHPLPGPGTGLIDKIKAAARNTIERYKAQARIERDTKQVLQMSDSMLKDIGLSHTDLGRLRTGQTSLKALNDQREAYRNQFN